jgi:hypothetical protein
MTQSSMLSATTNTILRFIATSTTQFLLVTSLLLLVVVPVCYAEYDTPSTREYALKAVCLYNFTHFAYWPAAKEPKKTEPVIIGVVGRSPFGSALENLQTKLQKTHKKNISIVYHGPYQGGMDLRQSHLLFISASQKNISAIIASLKGAPVLTVSEKNGFLEAGGMINLVVRNNKVRWAVNRMALNSAGIHLNAKLLQLAIRIKNGYNEPESQNHGPDDHDPWHLLHKALAGYPAWRLHPLC